MYRNLIRLAATAAATIQLLLTPGHPLRTQTLRTPMLAATWDGPALYAGMEEPLSADGRRPR